MIVSLTDSGAIVDAIAPAQSFTPSCLPLPALAPIHRHGRECPQPFSFSLPDNVAFLPLSTGFSGLALIHLKLL